MKSYEEEEDLSAAWGGVPGRALASHMQSSSPGRQFPRGLLPLLSRTYRRHHYACLNESSRADIVWWHTFLAKWNCISVLRKPSFNSLSILLAAEIKGSHWRGCTILCCCDNGAVLLVVTSWVCRDNQLAHLMRCLFFIEAHFHFSLVAKHVPGVSNVETNAIVQDNLPAFFASNTSPPPTSTLFEWVSDPASQRL